MRETYDDDAYTVEITWGRDVTGNDGPDTAVLITTKGVLGLEEATELARLLLEKLGVYNA